MLRGEHSWMYFVRRDREGVRTGADMFCGADTGNHNPRQKSITSVSRYKVTL